MIGSVRGFLYNVMGANELYSGDGHVHDENGVKQGPGKGTVVLHPQTSELGI